MRLSTEKAVETALASGCSRRSVHGGPWDHTDIDTLALGVAADACELFARPSSEGRRLVETARLVSALREQLAKAVWGDAASWRGLADWLDDLPMAFAEIEEVKSAHMEFTQVRDSVESNMERACGCGRSVRLAKGNWSHADLETATLQVALADLKAFPRPSEQGNRLKAVAGVALELRALLKGCNWSDAASWTGLATYLDSVEGWQRDEDEFRNVMNEFDEMRAATGIAWARSSVQMKDA